MNEEQLNSNEPNIQTEATETKELTEPEKTEGMETADSPKKKKPTALIIAAVVVLIALAAGIGIYNTPANRLSRQLDLGHKYLENEQYEEAVLAFERAIAIDDRSLEAYAGALEAYLGKGDQGETEAFYDRTLAVLSGLDDEFIAQNMDYTVEIYFAADEVYENNPEKAAEVLEDGLVKTGENQEIKDHLIKDYQQTAKEKAAGAAYEEALTVYDRLLELDNTNAETISGLCDCLNPYIDVLMESRQYDKIRELADKYKDVAADVDFASILAKIEELEKIEAENRAFMQKVYDLMAAEDYEGMHEVDGSEEAVVFVERMQGDHYLYFPEGNASQSGTVAGVYTDGGGGYYFYYGDVVNGERKGTGTEFLNIPDGGYYTFTGEWDTDAPNGEGVETIIGGMGDGEGGQYSKVSKGMLINGLWDGSVEAILTDESLGGDYDLSFTAQNGIPTEDRTEAYLSEVWWADDPGEGNYIYAYDYHSDVDFVWWSKIEEEGTVGIYGFVE